MRNCVKCGELKEDEEFYPDALAKDNLRTTCCDCDKKHSSSYYRNNIFAYRERSRDRYAKNKDYCKKEIAKWRQENPEKVVNFRNKYKNEETYKAQCKILSLKLKFKELGCSIKHFIYFIESILEEGMTWDNYRSAWVIVVPETKDYRDFRVRKV